MSFGGFYYKQPGNVYSLKQGPLFSLPIPMFAESSYLPSLRSLRALVRSSASFFSSRAHF